MQRHTIFFIIVNALHVLGSFSAHHQELKDCTYCIWYVPDLLAATASGTCTSKNNLFDYCTVQFARIENWPNEFSGCSCTIFLCLPREQASFISSMCTLVINPWW